MQFRGHSLPVRQSTSVSWAFTLSHFVSQIRLRDFFRLLAIGMCHFLPVHHFGMACLAGSKVNIQHRHLSLSSIAHKRSSKLYSVSAKSCCSSWFFCLCSSMWRGPQECITYELLLTSAAVSCMPGSSNFDSFRDGWLVAL